MKMKTTETPLKWPHWVTDEWLDRRENTHFTNDTSGAIEGERDELEGRKEEEEEEKIKRVISKLVRGRDKVTFF